MVKRRSSRSSASPPPTDAKVLKRGRPVKVIKPRGISTGAPIKLDYTNACPNTKRKRAQELVHSLPLDMKNYVFSILKKDLNQRDHNNEGSSPPLIKHTNETAACFFIKGRYSKRGFEYLATDARKRNAKIYPNIKKVQGL